MKQLNEIWDTHASQIANWSYKIAIAILLLFVASHLADAIKKKIQNSADSLKEKIDPILVPIMASVAKYALWGITLLIVLDLFGVNTNSIIALLGAAGIAVGLALKDTLQNIASGIMLIFLRPFHIGEVIECGPNVGSIEEINLFTTIMKSGDGLYMSVPNNILWGASIKNFNRNKTRMINLTIGISYKDNIDKAFTLIMDLLKADCRIHSFPESQVVLERLADSSVNLSVRCWTNVENYFPVTYDLNKKIKISLESNGLSLPFPQHEIYVHQLTNAARDK